MSSSVGNYHYVVYNEFEKPTQFAEKSAHLYGLKNVLSNPHEQLEPVQTSETINEQSNKRQLPHNCAAQSNFSDLGDLINATTSKQGCEGNVNVYNKCVFFVNNYNSGNVQEQERAKRFLDHFPGLISKPTHEPSNSSELPGLFQEIKRRNPDIWQNIPVGSNVNEAKPKATYKDDPIIVSSDSESETPIKEIHNTQKLFFVDRYDLKPILSPDVMPGVYKKVSQSTDVARKNKESNVFFDNRDKNGSIVRLKDFESIRDYSNSNLTYKTDDLLVHAQTNMPMDATTTKQTAVEMIDESSGIERDDRLWHLAYDILKLPFHNNCVQFNSSKDELIYRNPSTKRKIVYRIVQPTDLQLNALGTNKEKCLQLGNPTFVQCVSTNSTSAAVGNQTQSSTSKRPRGRPRKTSRRKTAALEEQTMSQIAQTLSPCKPQLTKDPTLELSSPQRSRYGRLSKPPQYIENNFQISCEASCQMSSSDNINDKTYKCNADVNIPCSEETCDEVRVKRERNLPPEYRCNVCNKIYLGKNMLRHFGAFPDHSSSPGVEQMVKDTSLYTFLVKKVQQPNLTEDQRITLLLKELTDFISQLQSRRSQLVTHKSAIYFVNSMVAQIIGAPEGHYGVDLSALSGPPPPINESTLAETAPARIDYSLSISLDDTIADAKLNLSENMMTSDDSLLRTVDDLVKQGIKNLTGGDEITQNAVPSVINYDHASDNAVEAVNMKETQPPPILDLSLDLFQFSSN